MRKKVVKLIDYVFQHHFQLTEAYDDSNSMRYLSDEFDIEIIGRFIQNKITEHRVKGPSTDYKVTFLPKSFSIQAVVDYILKLNPNVIHMHGNHGWPQYPIYASAFVNKGIKLIFSPAGASCGTHEFLECFDTVIVNHVEQIKRMRCPPAKVLVRHRGADPSVFYPVPGGKKKYNFVYVAGFVPQKRLDFMIECVKNTPYNMVILGDFTRLTEHYILIRDIIKLQRLENKIFLHDFIPQTQMSQFLGQCKVWVWPNIKPENPETTTNRSIIEALGCGMPLLVGERAFKNSHFLITGINGYSYSTKEEFQEKANLIMEDYLSFGKNSVILGRVKFSFQENFIDFYKNCYNSS